METEAKAKVVASVWGADFVKFLAALAVEFILFFYGRKPLSLTPGTYRLAVCMKTSIFTANLKSVASLSSQGLTV